MAANLWKTMLIVVAVLAYVGVAQAGVRADLSGDAVVDFATTMDMPLVTVGNPGNAGEWSGDDFFTPKLICGAVDYVYHMGKFEVTAGQYTEFLNAVAGTDTYGLYNPNMGDPSTPYIWGCDIQRSGSSGSYTYSVAADWTDRPVNYVNWGDAARFANWVTNGMPTGSQDTTTTEDGSYLLNGATSNEAMMAVTRKSPGSGGRYYIPTEDEWYKAAYYDPDKPGGAGYWDYPTSSDAEPSNDLTDPDPGNNANFYQSGLTIGSPYYRTEVGEFENSESPYGTFDQGGNVWEWNEAIVEESCRGLRGGSVSFSDGGYLHASGRSFDGYPTGEDGFIGFRVSEVPEPVTTEVPRVEENRDIPEAAGPE